MESVEQAARISPEEVDYLIAAANRFLAKPVSADQIVSTYAGVRPLYDDGSANPSEVTRDYVLKMDLEHGKVPLLTIFGGKITTYRRLAEEAFEHLASHFPNAGRDWTANGHLPGGDVGHFNAFRDAMHAKYAGLGRELIEGVVRRHGSLTPTILGDAKDRAALGRDFGGGLTEREASYFIENEWAASPEDILWRRTKCGLHMSQEQRATFERWMREPR